MNRILWEHSQRIIREAIEAVKPDEAVKRALSGREFPGRVILVAAGKAAWQMAKAAHECMGERIERGVVVTKYGHVQGPIGHFACCEGGHPVPDGNSFRGTEAALEQVRGLGPEDTVIFLLSGGGSALFEVPLVPEEELKDITGQLLASGADIVQMNTVRKRLSAVKGGRFAQLCAPARVLSVVLSDILGDPLDMIASGPAYPDSSTCSQAMEVARRYGLRLSPLAQQLLSRETPKALDNVETVVNGSVRELCRAAEAACSRLGYRCIYLTDRLSCQAREAGSFLASIIKSHGQTGENLAFIAGGETVVHLKGKGKGGRNQELALAAAPILEGMGHAALFSVGSDGTDGPTDAAGGYADGDSMAALRSRGWDVHAVLEDNNAYAALGDIGSLIVTGPTGTNVNDVAVALIRGGEQ